MPVESLDKAWLTPAEVATLMKVSPVTVRSWSQKGLLESEITPGGHRRYNREVVDRFRRTWTHASKKSALRILVVDDDLALVGFLKELLGDDPGKALVETAYDGFDAGQKVLTFQPDVVLLDLMMPGMRGSEVCRRIKAIPGNRVTRVLAMSGYLSPENEAELMQAGAEMCFSKPLDTKLLLQTLGLEP